MHELRQGTILQDTYRIGRLLGQGGFGLTYEAFNTRLDMRVAIKELYWLDHSERDTHTTDIVSLTRSEDEPTFEYHKERFLREAHILRDIAGAPEIVRILDYFEANATAYIVMEYAEGITLEEYVRRSGPIDCNALFTKLLPMANAIETLHNKGILHRDISPDNIIVSPDGALRLIDLGAARSTAELADKHNAIAKHHYTPTEQIDRNGTQGPWTDIYAFCATMYYCLTGMAPDSAMQRVFLDELKAPSALGASLSAEQEKILLKGMSMKSGDRWQSISALAEAMRATLPHEKTTRSYRTPVLILSALLVVILAVGGFFGYRAYKTANRFRGIETAQFVLWAGDSMTAAEYGTVRSSVITQLDALAGPDGYAMDEQGTLLSVELPLSCFEGPVREILTDRILADVIDGDFYYNCKLNAIWEDPRTSSAAGTNQVSFGALKGETLVISYETELYFQCNRISRMATMMSIKEQLDALGAPYAFGTLYGAPGHIVIGMSRDIADRFIINMIGDDSLYITDPTCKNPVIVDSGAVSLYTDDDVTGLTVSEAFKGQFDAFKTMDADTTLYLVDSAYVSRPIAICRTAAGSLSGNTLTFTEFLLDEAHDTAQERLMLCSFVIATVCETQFPFMSSNCFPDAFNLLDSDGHILWDIGYSEAVVSHFVDTRIKTGY